jgi:hypothetical protein
MAGARKADAGLQHLGLVVAASNGQSSAMRLPALALIAGLCGTAAPAAPAPLPADRPATTVSPLTVAPPGDAPKVVATWPAAGAAVAGGVMILTITFDQKMAGDSFNITMTQGGDGLQCLKTPRLLNDGKTFVLLCTGREKKSYTVAFNAGPGAGFANIGQQRAAPATLSFTTTDADGPRNIADAMKIENLPTIDLPIQDAPAFEAKPE